MRKKLISLLLCAVMALGMLLPAYAWEWPESAANWQDYIESVTPVGDAPRTKLKLTPTAYVFTDWRLPTAYDVTMKDGSVQRCTVSGEPTLYSEDFWVGYLFDVETVDGPVTLYAAIIRTAQDSGECDFQIAQYLTAQATDDEGESFGVFYSAVISNEPCETEVEPTNVIVRILFRFYMIYTKLRRFFFDIRQKIQ